MADKSDDEAKYWQNQITTAEKDSRYTNWCDVAQKFYDRYLLEADGMTMNTAVQGLGGAMVYNLLWSNTETLLPMLYSRLPEPYVSREFGNRDPVARMAATIAERVTTVDLKKDDFDDQAEALVKDYYLTGRGTLRAIYESTVVNSRIAVTEEPGEDGAPRFITEHGDEIPEDMLEKAGRQLFVLDPEITEERAPLIYHNWRDFLIGPGRKWKEVQKRGWIDWITYMTKQDAKIRFGEEIAEKLNYTFSPYALSDKGTQKTATSGTESKQGYLARIDELWDARSRQVFWTSPGYEGLLDKEPDYLDLEGFFNTPRPLLATTGNDSMIPVPDYAEYRTQAKELDEVTAKIEQIMEEVRAGGVYDSSQPNLGTAMRNKTGGWHGVDNWAKFAAAGGMTGATQPFNIQESVAAVVSLYEHRMKVKRDADEISGMIDLFRGQQTQKDETLGQSEIRAGMGGLRINDKQRDFQRYMRDALGLKAEIIVSKFESRQILEMADFQALLEESPELTQIRAMKESPEGQKALQDPEQSMQIGFAEQQATQRQLVLIKSALKLLKDDRMRGFKLDIETDATVALDQAQEKQEAGEFVSVVGDFLQNVLNSEAIAANPGLKALAAEMLMFIVRKYRIGRSLEQKIEEVAKELAMAPPPEQQPDALTMDVMRQSKADDQDFEIDKAKVENDKQENRIKVFQALTDKFEALTERMEANVNNAATRQDGIREDIELANEVLEGGNGAGNA